MFSSYISLNKSRKSQYLTHYQSAGSNRFHGLSPPWHSSNTTKCDPNEHTPRTNKPSPNNPFEKDILQIQQELEKPCKACLYTGVLSCAGLSLYFVKLATDETTLAKNRRFLWACSAGWVVAGVYRWSMG